MPYTPPQFNVPCDVWTSGTVPSSDDPAFENVASQFYIYSRVSVDVHPCELELYHPVTQIRLPVAAIIPWEQGQVFEIPSESGRYYRAKLKERIHLGFPNEYLVAYVVQCNALGEPFQRDIENSVPCDHEPAEHEAAGAGAPTVETEAAGEALHIGSGDVHNAFGSNLEPEVSTTAAGEAFNTGPP